MRIILFPTRFYPAISGGDYYLQVLGEQFQKNREIRIDPDTNERNAVHFFTSDAIDFAALHGSGKRVDRKHKNFSTYRGLQITRFDTPCKNHGNNTTYEDSIRKFRQLAQNMLNLEGSTIDFFIEKGPIFTGLTNLIYSGNLRSNYETPEISHTSYLPYANIVYALLIAKVYGCPSVITPFLHEENRRYHHSAIKDVLGKFDLILACTPSEKTLYIKMGLNEQKIEVLPMGIELPYYTSDHSAYIKKTVQNTNPTILFCGYKNYEKGSLTLLHAIPLVTKNFGPVNFIFIGPSSKAFNYEMAKLKPLLRGSKLINLSPDNLTGVYDKKKIGAFQYADVFCMPSRSDAYGIVYLEAWVSKTPVIGADIAAMRDVINNGEDGFLIPFDAPDILAEKIIHLLRNPELRTQMGEAGYKKVIKNNQWGTIAKQTYEFYRSLITRRVDAHEK